MTINNNTMILVKWLEVNSLDNRNSSMVDIILIMFQWINMMNYYSNNNNKAMKTLKEYLKWDLNNKINDYNSYKEINIDDQYILNSFLILYYLFTLDNYWSSFYYSLKIKSQLIIWTFFKNRMELINIIEFMISLKFYKWKYVLFLNLLFYFYLIILISNCYDS